MANDDTDRGNETFEGLLAASDVPVSDTERENLRKAYETLSALAHRARRPGRSWGERPLSLHVPRRRPRP